MKLLNKIETVVQVTCDGVVEIPVADLVAGDVVRITLVVEQLLVDGEMNGLVRSYQSARREIAQSAEDSIPFDQVGAKVRHEPSLPASFDDAVATAKPKPIWEIIKERADALPDELVAKLPTDGAEQHDHYIYGTPKKLVV